jgi:hypothetical protein
MFHTLTLQVIVINTADLLKDTHESQFPLNPAPHWANASQEDQEVHPPVKCSCHLLTSSLSRQATVGKLSDEVLLNIFRYYLGAASRFWPRIVHICRRWRRIVFVSQRALDLRLFCTRGMAVQNSIDCWPALLIAVHFGGFVTPESPTPEDEDNIMAALVRSDRLTSINLTISVSLLEKLSAIEGPFSELEDLVLVSQDSWRLTLPSSFRWGERLRRLRSTGIAFPALVQLLYSSRNLVDLRLHNFIHPSHFSPEALTSVLSGLTQLRSLSIHFLSTISRVSHPPPFGGPIVLPALTSLNFRGLTQYFEDLVARIDAPRLEDIKVAFFTGSKFNFSKFRGFADRTGMSRSHRRAYILSSQRVICISLTQPGLPTCFQLQLFSESLDEQLSFITEVCSHLSASFSKVEDLRINTTRPLGLGDSLYSRLCQWRVPIKSFTGVKWFHLNGNDSKDIIRALLRPGERPRNVLPALHKLYISPPGPPDVSLTRAAARAALAFMTSRRLSGHPIFVEFERLCHTQVSEPRGTGNLQPECLLNATTTTC